MSAAARTSYRSQITPWLRYGLALGAAWGSTFNLFGCWYLDKGGMIQMSEFFIAACIWSVSIVLFCILLRQLLRIPALGRFWFTSRLPAVVCILIGHIIYFAVNFRAMTIAPIDRVAPPYDPISISIGVIILFVFGFMEFPFLRKRAEFVNYPPDEQL
jgi:hypothetical protein